MPELGPNRYGKSGIRLVTVQRGGDRHDLRDRTVDVSLEGAFRAAHVDGDNAGLIATDTMKNTVYALAREQGAGSPEAFGLDVARHFAGFAQVSRATVTIREHGWRRISTPAGPAPDAFSRSGDETRVAIATAGDDGSGVEAGIEGLTVLKTTKSAFVGFDRDRYTTLPEAEDRIMATRIEARWGYDRRATAPGFPADRAFGDARSALLETFAEHVSPSVQASVWTLARAMFAAVPEIDWVRMVLPNLHHWAVDLTPFGLDNPAQVFVATTEPHGLIEATVRRAESGA